MKFFTSIICLQVTISLVAIGSDALLERNLTEWSLYKLEHGKSYDNQQVDALRMELYYQTKEYVETYNRERSQATGITLGLNHMSDWTTEEKSRLNGLRVPEKMPQNSARAQKYLDNLLKDISGDLPDEVDWRKVPGTVSGIKNQGFCGSCWAFAATGALEGQQLLKNKTKTLIPLSEQYLVDCDTDDYGCNGGLMISAFNFINDNGGIEGEQSYPYIGMAFRCAFQAKNVVMTDSGGAMLKPYDEQNMKRIVAKIGPLAVGICGRTTTFQTYKSGIFKEQYCPGIDHGVLIVGYGTDKETKTDYWIVKNSWGTGWGEQGYVRLAMGQDTCCVSQMATVPIMD